MKQSLFTLAFMLPLPFVMGTLAKSGIGHFRRTNRAQADTSHNPSLSAKKSSVKSTMLETYDTQDTTGPNESRFQNGTACKKNSEISSISSALSLFTFRLPAHRKEHHGINLDTKHDGCSITERTAVWVRPGL